MVREEKKVEYLELVYDLIFVYIIGRSNSMLQVFEGGFVSEQAFVSYVISTLAIIQIWNFSTFYTNLYGKNGVRDHIFMFINMYLLYYMARGTRVYWQFYANLYHTAWTLILVNIGVQHLIEMKNHKDAPWEREYLWRRALIILVEAGLVAANGLMYATTGLSMAYVPIAFGLIAAFLTGKANSKVPVDFEHLTERAMLYVVFTFGEMIIAISGYFNGGVSANSFYFSLMAFLIVVGLFLSYGVLYNRIIDRSMMTNGTGYMTIHIFLIFALNNISASLEFMREEEVELLPKVVFLTGSFVLYYVFMFLTVHYAKKRGLFNLQFILVMIAVAASFVVLMLLFREQMKINIAITVLYVLAIFLLLLKYGREECV